MRSLITVASAGIFDGSNTAMTQPLIMLKFTQTRDVSSRQRDIEEWIGSDLERAKPLFPDVDDADLSTLYEVHLKKGCAVNSIVDRLQEQDEVEYAHTPSPRRPK